MRLSLYGLMNVRPDVLDELHLPVEIDRHDLINMLYMKSWDLELVYPFPDFMKEMVGSWSAAHLWEWQKLVNTTKLDYNPIWNKDGVIIETEDRDTTGTTSGTGRENRTDTTTGSTNAFNGGAFQDREKTDGTSGRDWADRNDAVSKETIGRKREEHGNIGVTSTQQMIKEEREISYFSVYEVIAKEFTAAFCLGVY